MSMRLLGFVLMAWMAGSGLAVAQGTIAPGGSATPRADAHAVLGWRNLHREQSPDYYDNWINDIFVGGAGAGWYWNDHLKTQVDFNAGTVATQHRFRGITVNGRLSTEFSHLEARQDSLAIGQQYQFFRNQWFHPHVGAGLDIARETSTVRYEPVVTFDNSGRVSGEVVPARTEGPQHRILARPFAEAGLKAYLTRRAFFTADSRLMIRGGIDEVLFRFGFGIDF